MGHRRGLDVRGTWELRGADSQRSTNRHTVAPTLTDHREWTRRIEPVSCSNSAERLRSPPLGLYYWRLFFSASVLFFGVGRAKLWVSMCVRGVLRGIIESTEGASSLHLMIWRWRQAPSGAPCQSFWAHTAQTSIKTHKKNSPTRAPGWIADANVKDSAFCESFSTQPWALHNMTVGEKPPLPHPRPS